MKVTDLEQKILPLYAKNRIQYDVHTYSNILRMYLDMREINQVFALYDKFKATGMKPNKWLVSAVLEAGIRDGNTDRVYETVSDCVEH